MEGDLLVSGGVPVDGTGPVDVLVVAGRVAAVAEPGTVQSPAGTRRLDASGALVMPGLVDAHVHVRDPGLTHKEDFETATQAAAAGGVTTIMVMPYDDPPAVSGAALTANAEQAAGKAFVDYAMQGAVGPHNTQAVAELAAAGAVSVEVQLAEAHPAVGVPDTAGLRDILVAARRVDVPVGIYCETEALFAAAVERLTQAGRRDPGAHIASKEPLGEHLAAIVACLLAEDTGASVHLRQVSTAAAVEVATAARDRGVDVTVETTPHYLSLTADDEVGGGPDMKVSPPLRSSGDVAALRAALARGRIDVVATDHAPHAPEEKARGRDDIWKAPGGFPGLETLLHVLLDVCGDAGPAAAARVSADLPARRFGLAGRKGRIAPGFDGDLLVVDPSASSTLTPEKLHTKARYSPFLRRTLPGALRFTVVRGRVVTEDGTVAGSPQGQWLRRGRRA